MMWLSWSVCPSTSLTVMGPSIPWGRKTLSLFYRWGNRITESLPCCRQGWWLHAFLVFDFWPTAPDLSVKNAYFCLVFSAQNTKESKTIQDALAEIVSVLLLWLDHVPLQFLPLTIPFPKHTCNLLAIFRLLHSLVLYFSNHTSCWTSKVCQYSAGIECLDGVFHSNSCLFSCVS